MYLGNLLEIYHSLLYCIVFIGSESIDYVIVMLGMVYPSQYTAQSRNILCYQPTHLPTALNSIACLSNIHSYSFDACAPVQVKQNPI